MKIPLITILIVSSCLHLEAVRSSTSPAVSEAFCNTRSHQCKRITSRKNKFRFLDDERKINRSRSSSQILSFVASSIHNQNEQYQNNNNSRLDRKYFRASSNASRHHHATNSCTTPVAVTTTLWFRYALNRIRQVLLQKWSQGMKIFRVLTIASILLVPSMASSSSSSSSSYYLQGNPFQTTHQHQQRSEISIQTQPSQPYRNRDTYTVTSQRQYPQTTRFVKQRSNKNSSSSSSSRTQTQKVKRTTLFIMLLTLAASSFRASLRKSKIVRNVTPFGVIRNASPLGNGVSVIRVCMALKVDSNDDGGSNTKRLLNKLHLEEKELYTNISMLSQDDPRVKQQQQQKLDGAYSFRQQALGRYVSNVASTLLQYTNCIRYGNMESIRVPFVEDAVREFRQVAKEERRVFADTAAALKRKRNVMPPEHKKKKLQQDEEDDDDGTSTTSSNSNSNRKKSGYILATILLSIKGDRTSVPLPFGIVRQRDVGRALSRIATDAKVEDCLVGSEISWVPNHIPTLLSDEDDIDAMLLSEKEVLKAFPDLMSLT
mmetsp:Transcript_12862/g.19830  ORF Transcript_12862/g.19830 Transcript_12862/m.19830 type:complete len:544 (-) Transcript_12862:541-2172(-)